MRLDKYLKVAKITKKLKMKINLIIKIEWLSLEKVGPKKLFELHFSKDINQVFIKI